MIKHIVFFRFTESLAIDERRERSEVLKSIFSPLKELKYVHSYEVGVNISESDFAWDVVINSSFESKELLKKYSISDEHQDAIKKGRQFEKEKSVIDYEY